MVKKIKTWVPHVLDQRSKNLRLEFCKKFKKRFFRNGYLNTAINWILTGDETWIFLERRGHKNIKEWYCQKKQPKGYGNVKPSNMTIKKRMVGVFFDAQGNYYTEIIPKGGKADRFWWLAFLKKVYNEHRNKQNEFYSKKKDSQKTLI